MKGVPERWMDLADIAEYFTAGGSAEELYSSYAKRIEQEDRRFKSCLAPLLPDAVHLSRAADSRRAANVTLGELDGVPIAVKDLVEICGETSTVGSLAWKDRRATRTATVVRRMLGAGMPIIARTAMVEFACGGWGTNYHFGTPRNPWSGGDPHVPGGSSSGSAVAVAAGLSPLAIGTDTGGSVRLPASMCCITGLKVTRGRISRYGIFQLSEALDSVGPMARCARGAAALLNVLAGPDVQDSATWEAPRFEPRAVRRDAVQDCTIAILECPEIGQVDEDVALAFDEAARVFRELGATVLRRNAPEPMSAIQGRCSSLILADGYRGLASTLEEPQNADSLDPHVRSRLLSAQHVTLAEYDLMKEDLHATRRKWAHSWQGIDAFITPTTPFAAPRLADADEGKNATISVFTRAANYLDWCAIAIPMGFTGAGMPLSLQIMAAPYEEAKVLSLACAFQAVTDWHRRRPPIDTEDRFTPNHAGAK